MRHKNGPVHTGEGADSMLTTGIIQGDQDDLIPHLFNHKKAFDKLFREWLL